MSGIEFDRLRDVALRDAWKHEALAFTPWLAENIDHISEAVGVPLELTGTEVAVESFSADILARNPQDDSLVLIENQLEQTDHTHLGQIMTYLAGLNARTVVWIAPAFREPHLSAVRWLNENTADGFSFFAVRLRVVRIGDSPFAPIFEVVEKPSNWDRRLKREAAKSDTEAGLRRARFWDGLLERHPELANVGLKGGRETNKWFKSAVPEIIVGLYLAASTCGIYMRGVERSDPIEVRTLLLPGQARLEQALGVPLDTSDSATWFFTDKIDRPFPDEAYWLEIIDWMAERLPRYMEALAELADNSVG